MVLPAEMIRSWQIMFSFPYCSNFDKIKKTFEPCRQYIFFTCDRVLNFLTIHFSSALDFPSGGLLMQLASTLDFPGGEMLHFAPALDFSGRWFENAFLDGRFSGW